MFLHDSMRFDYFKAKRPRSGGRYPKVGILPEKKEVKDNMKNKSIKLTRDSYTVVSHVLKNGPALKKGIKKGDIILSLSVNGKRFYRIKNPAYLSKCLKGHPKVNLRLYRDGKMISINGLRTAYNNTFFAGMDYFTNDRNSAVAFWDGMKTVSDTTKTAETLEKKIENKLNTSESPIWKEAKEAYDDAKKLADDIEAARYRDEARKIRAKLKKELADSFNPVKNIPKKSGLRWYHYVMIVSAIASAAAAGVGFGTVMFPIF